MFRPCIDIHNGKVKQIVGGTLSDLGKVVENYVSTKPPSYYANLFKKEKLVGGHVIMLGEGNQEAALEALKAYPGGLQVGGGITDANALFYLENGASHVIVTSYVFNHGEIHFEKLNRLKQIVSKEKLVLDLSCRLKDNKYYVVTNRWQTYTDYELNKENIELLEDYCDEFLIHGVDVEGKKQGIELNLVEKISQWATIPTTYAGGIKSFNDIKKINQIGQGRIHYTVGSALDIFGGNLKYQDIIRYEKEVANGQSGKY